MTKALNRLKLEHVLGYPFCFSLPIDLVFMEKKHRSIGETGTRMWSCTIVQEKDPLARVVESLGIYCKPSQVPKI